MHINIIMHICNYLESAPGVLTRKYSVYIYIQWRTQEFCSGGGVQQIQLRTERTGIWGR